MSDNPKMAADPIRWEDEEKATNDVGELREQFRERLYGKRTPANTLPVSPLTEARARQFGTDLIYDALRLTSKEAWSWDAVIAALRILRRNGFDEKGLHSIDTILRDGGMSTVSQMLCETVGHLNTLPDENLEVRRPITVVLEDLSPGGATALRGLTGRLADGGEVDAKLELDSNDKVSAHWPEARLFGEGPTASDAMDALRQEIVAAYLDMEDLVRQGKRFDGYAASLWAVLQTCVSRRDKIT